MWVALLRQVETMLTNGDAGVDDKDLHGNSALCVVRAWRNESH
jgi:hypothetical protein